jgi:putative ABC transport system permease protein
MSFVKRAVLSIVRRPGKSLILFLVILIIGNLIAGTVAVRQAILQSEAIAKESLGASVSIGQDDQALMKVWEAGEEPIIENLTAEVIEELGARPEVRSFDYTLSTYLGSKTLQNYVPTEDSGEAGAVGVAVAGPGSVALGYFNLRGTRYAAILPLEEGKLSLVEGRVFTTEEIAQGNLVAVIPKGLAETNNLHAGDTIILNNEIMDYTAMAEGGSVTTEPALEQGTPIASRDVVLEVIGIFELNSGTVDASVDDDDSSGLGGRMEWDPNAYAENEVQSTIYVPIEVALAEAEFMEDAYRKIAEDAGEDLGSEKYEPWYTPIYMLNSADDLESFEEAALDLLPEYWMVISARSQYEQIAAPMKDIQQIMTTALIAAVVAALIIISLVVVLFLRDRRSEFGIYLSLGARRPTVVGQVLIEVILVSVVALGIALFTGNLISGGISQQMIENQIAAQSANDLYGGSLFSYGGDAGLLVGNLSLEDLVENYYQVGLSLPYVLSFLGLGLGAVVLSCAVPLLYVLRLKPKKILM